MNDPTTTGAQRQALAGTVLRTALRRLPGMAAVWLGFGAVAGALTAPPGGAVAVAAGVMAGVIVLTPLGLSLALVGGRVVSSLAGGLLGVTSSPLATHLGLAPDGISAAAFGLIFGGVMGATAVVVLTQIRRLVSLASTGKR